MYTFFSKNQIILAEAHCSYFFSGFQAHLSLFCSFHDCQLAKTAIAVGGWGIHIFGAKVLYFPELPGVYTKMVNLKVKSCTTTANLRNTTFLSMTEH